MTLEKALYTVHHANGERMKPWDNVISEEEQPLFDMAAKYADVAPAEVIEKLHSTAAN